MTSRQLPSGRSWFCSRSASAIGLRRTRGSSGECWDLALPQPWFTPGVCLQRQGVIKMTLNMTTVLISLAMVCVWVALSYGAYRFLVSFSVPERNWIDRTSIRRIAWVVASPLFWVFVIAAALVLPLYGALSSPVFERWNDSRPRREKRKHERHMRRQHFLSDPSD
ncbi:MAG: hypothetical protein JWM00_567 [Candidatus Saccharibacteria bacterium]|nr:hypothetical protein [Candidatus Saccharibacteria bacterium]